MMLNNHRILISGVSGVLGRALALASAREGAELILLARRKARLEALDDEIAAMGAPAPLLVELDFHRASDGHYPELAAALADLAAPGLDGLVIASGLHTGLHPLEHLPVTDWQRIMNVNLHGPFRLIHALLPLLRQRRGQILAAVDSPALAGKAYWGAYAASQAALRALLTGLAEENENRLGVQAIEMRPMPSPLRGLVYPGEDPATLPPLAGNVERIMSCLRTPAVV